MIFSPIIFSTFDGEQVLSANNFVHVNGKKVILSMELCNFLKLSDTICIYGAVHCNITSHLDTRFRFS